jgi:predicted phage terminase large subunit-like protein
MKAVDEMIRMQRAHKPLYWWAEKGHISKSIGPFLKDRMQDERSWMNLVEVTPVKDKMTRAQSFQAMCARGMVRWPCQTIASWFDRARREMLLFPNGSKDDFVDFCAHLGKGVNSMVNTTRRIEPKFVEQVGYRITMNTIRRQMNHDKRTASFATR